VGTYELADNRLNVRDVETTLLACGSPARSDIHAQERQYVGALAIGGEVSFERDRLQIASGNGSQLNFVRCH
jgi:hypothetical protein